MSFFWVYLFSYLFEKDSILEKAENVGFFYKNTEISEVTVCKPEKNAVCVQHNGKIYLAKKSGNLEITAEIVKDSIHLTVSPDPAYISYFLYIQSGCNVHKIQITKREIILEEKAANITRLQITGTGVGGPEILWSRKFKEEKLPPFSNNFDTSLKSLRKSCKKSNISIDKRLEEAAQKSLEKVQSEGLKHYSSKDGGIRHTGVHKKILGENLFTAKNEAEAWKMLVSSPSHLYNLINPQFRHYFYAIKKEKDETSGAIVFSD
ncbi:hypothetical protein J6W78_00825 [bacterium]|nr:hypothetical protein [bacterium]